MNWSVLGIEATKDKKAIKKAYREKLIHTNPEDKPEEFKALRAAYEEAMALADQVEKQGENPENVQGEKSAEDQAEKTPMDLWLDRLGAIYGIFQDRNNVDCWRALLSDEICQALDTRPDAEDAMIRFLMENYHLSHKVWLYLDEQFSFMERKNELYERYPKNFVDYVIINGITYEDNMPFEMFEPGENGAECELLMKLFNEADAMPIAESGEKIAEMEKLSESHPHARALSFYYRFTQGETEAIEGVKALGRTYPSDFYILSILSNIYIAQEQWTELEAVADKSMELRPDDYSGRWFMAQALAGQGKYEQAIDHLNDMMRLCSGNDAHLDLLYKVRKNWNEKLAKQYRAQLEEKPDDQTLWFELAWCYLQNDMLDEAVECASHVSENQPGVFEYNNLMCNIYLDQNAFEAALHCNEALLAELARMQAEDSKQSDAEENSENKQAEIEGKPENMKKAAEEDRAKKLRRFPEMLTKKGSILTFLGRYQEAEEAFVQALAMKPDSVELLGQIVKTKIYAKDYEGTLGYAQKYVDVLPHEFLSHYYLAFVQKMLNNDRAAFSEVNTAIDLDPSDFRGYELKLLILVRNGVYDQANELIGFLKENGAGDADVVRWCTAWIAKEEASDAGDGTSIEEETLAIYQALAEEIERDGREYIWLPDFYSQLADLTAAVNDSKNICDRQLLLDILDKGLKWNPEDNSCLDYKAWLLKREKRYDESREIYEKLVTRYPHSVRIKREIADIYYADLERSADKAAAMYDRIIENDEQRDDHFYAGMSYYTMGNLEEAAKHFRREEEMDSEDEDGFYRLSYVYETMGLYEEALQQADRSIELVKSWNDGKLHASRFDHKAQIYRRMGKPEEAVKVYREAMALYGKKYNGHKMIFYTYLQFGMLDDAEKLLKEWKKFSPNVVGNKYDLPRLAAVVELQFIRKQFLKAKFSFVNYADAMFPEDKDSLAFLIDSTKGGSAQVYLQHREESMKAVDQDHGDYPGYISGYADALWLNGRQDEARKYAQIALDKLDEILKRFYRHRTMHLTKKISLLYLLGRPEEARACYEEIQHSPMCEVCPYRGCKDADIYTVRGLIYQGRKEEALKLTVELQKKWPDETDFIFYENVLRKK